MRFPSLLAGTVGHVWPTARVVTRSHRQQRLVARCSAQGEGPDVATDEPKEEGATLGVNNSNDIAQAAANASAAAANGAGAPAGASEAEKAERPAHLDWSLNPDELAQLDYSEPNNGRKMLTSLKLAFAWPWR